MADRPFAVQPFVGEIIDPACGCGNIVEAARHTHQLGNGENNERLGNAI